MGLSKSGTRAWIVVVCVIYVLPYATGQNLKIQPVVDEPLIMPAPMPPAPVPPVDIDNEEAEEKIALEKQAEIRNRAFGAGYLAIAPKVMCAGGHEKVFLTFTNFTQPVDVQFAVLDKNDESVGTSKLETFSTPCGCLDVHLNPSDSPRKTVTLVMYAKRTLMQCEEFEIVKKIKVYLDACYTETFIETDKPMYKAGQNVHFRVLTLHPDLRPDISEVDKIWIEAPGGVHMAQWLGVETNQGLIDETMKLSTNPTQGEWTIKVLHHNRDFSQKFTVGEYVLPKYEVMVQGPDYVVVDVEQISVVVCGRYTHGQPVVGSIILKVGVLNYPDKSVETSAEAKAGCFTFEVDMTKLDLMSSSYNVWNAKLHLEATFEEASTNHIMLKTSDSTKIVNKPFHLEFSAPSTFKPGLSYSGALLFTDPSDKPLADTKSEINIEADGVSIFKETVISDAKGMAFFSVTTIPSGSKSVTLKAVSKGYFRQSTWHPKNGGTHGIQDPTAYDVAQPQISPSNSFLHIDPVLETAGVNSFQSLTIHLTSDKPEYNGVYLHTVMMSRGNILLSVESIIPPEDIDGFRRPGTQGVYPVDTDEYGRKEYPTRTNMEVTDIPVNILNKGQSKTTRRKIRILYEMAPAVSVMVYYIREDGEVVADTITIPVEEVFQNEVDVSFDEKTAAPGDSAVLSVRAKASSLCAFGVVDKSVHLLGGDNRLTKKKVFEALEGLQLSSEGGSAEPSRCSSGGGMFRGYMPPQNLNDASQAFKDLGVVYLTNLKVDTAPCPEVNPYMYFRGEVQNDGGDMMMAMPMMMMAVMEDSAIEGAVMKGAESDAAGPTIRSYFPETWLYQLVEIDDSGHKDINVHVPHTITKWIGHGFCTSTKYGAGVSDLTSITAFQAFFIDMRLPYSVIRYELVPVTVVVFNYITECLMVELTLEASSSYEIDDQNRVEKLCVCAGESQSVSFYVKAIELGDIPIQVAAVSVEASGACIGREMDDSLLGVSDTVLKKLLVKPEGIETEQVFSTFFCPVDYENGVYIEDIILKDLPENFVSGSERGIITLTGDMMGPSISNLDQLLRMPTGCGEQNMIGFVPNIFVLHYLTGINKLTPGVEAKAKQHMEIGYQRELTYQHTDGSYSAFGMSDPSGSTWLTAFVVRSFAQASKYIFIDPEELAKSKVWLLSLQQKDGCFKSVGKVIHKDMMGNVNDQATLTAYVMISLIEAGDASEAEHIQKGVQCLNKEVDIQTADMYTLALSSYAYILAGSPHTDTLLERLNELAVESEGLMHWEGAEVLNTDKRSPYLHRQASSQNIEITSYVLLTYVRSYDKSQALVKGNPVARWIVGQRNAEGGFSSTQDTVMALQALADYSMMAYSGGNLDISLGIKFSCDDDIRKLHVTQENSLLLQIEQIPEVPVEIKMTATGSGCALTQVIVTYNIIPEVSAEPPFTIDISSVDNRNPRQFPCISYSMTICAHYNGEDEFSNMAVIQVRMVSGFEPESNSLQALEQEEGGPKMVEHEGKEVNFYYDQLEKEDTCVSFMVTREEFVKEPRKGIVTVFDYYEKSLSVSELYDLECKR
nr:sea star footprint protein 9 [Asterias rubens]